MVRQIRVEIPTWGRGVSKFKKIPMSFMDGPKSYLLISGNCSNEYDDVTLFSDAAKTAIKKALDTGSKVESD